MSVNVDRFNGRGASQETIVIINRGARADAAEVTTRVTDNDGAVLIDHHDRVWVGANDEGIYTLNITVPERALAKGAPWIVHALLPPDAKPRCKPHATQPPPIDGGRTVLTWTGVADPLIPIVWHYL